MNMTADIFARNEYRDYRVQNSCGKRARAGIQADFRT